MKIYNLNGMEIFETNGADLQGADLQGADLRGADLREADLDFSCLPLWCGSANIIIDDKQARQLLSHAFNLGLNYFPNGLTKEQKEWLNGFHRITSNEFPKFK